ncbi:hypothetical protein [Gordonia otitidis]|uniref:hypothetical protein n=1 Tax=Gordonia otitidis TaxID=249058 RepID=UPI002354508F|nr:hypothetical protein [Gordonia otitidis]
MSFSDVILATEEAAADAKKKYSGPTSSTQAGARPNVSGVGDTLWWTGTNLSIIALTERSRRSIVVVNRSATQTLTIGLGSLDSTVAPGSGTTTIPPGGYWTTTDARPVFASFPSSGDYIQIKKEVNC